MKKLYLLLICLVTMSQVFSQAPTGFKYQAVARDGSGAVLANKTVSFRISIIQGMLTGDILYSETHSALTNEFGLVNLDLYDELSPVVFHHGGQRMVIMPIRPDPVPASAPKNPPPPEAAAEANPSATQSQPSTEENKPMVTQTNTTTPTASASDRGSLKPKPEDAGHGTALKTAIEHIEALKGRLRDVASELTQAVDLIKAAEKEKKASEKEVESVRATLRSLQRVQI